MEASCWVARKIFLSAAKASSRARTLDSRPTTNGVIMNGKITTSRMGIMGIFLVSNFSLDVVTQSPLGVRRMTRAEWPGPNDNRRLTAPYQFTPLLLSRLLHHSHG